MPQIDPASKSTKIKMVSLLIYFLISIGVALQIGGSNWDIVWHGVKNVESFLTPPHTVIYTGVALAIGSIVFRLIYFPILAIKNNSISKQAGLSNVIKSQSELFPFPIKLAFIGVSLQLTAGPFDFWWHNNFGFDGLLSPPHAVLATGMFIAALGGLSGVFKHYKDNSPCHVARACIVISFGVFLMVGVDLVLMFTLPFSNGQYFDFNPEPFTAMFTASILIPFAMTVFLFSMSSSLKIPYFFTCITAVIITIQATATIISNSYFAWLFPYYILNISPAIVADLFLLKQLRDQDNHHAKSAFNSEKRYLLASMLLSSFFITLFFPWTVDVFGGFFKPSDDVRTEEFLLQILFPIILPVFTPISILSSFIGGIAVLKLKKKSLNSHPKLKSKLQN
jgi:hypothetical protein